MCYPLRSPTTAQNRMPLNARQLAESIEEADEEELLAEVEVLVGEATTDEGGWEVVVAAELVDVVDEQRTKQVKEIRANASRRGRQNCR